MNIKDYLHLYLGGPVINTITGEEGYLHTANMEFTVCQPEQRNKSSLNLVQIKNKAITVFFLHEWKLALRPLEDMTEDEDNECENEINNNDDAYGFASKTKYLLSKHFDLFGLIDAGLAIDKTTLK